ncbi:MAG TPA: TonB family protein [Gemmatimonadales bacterium]|nr:TonB family protein [Gemmatimonadales bacterium]
MSRLLLSLALLLAACSSEPPLAGEFHPAVPVEGQEPIPYPSELFSAGVEGQVLLYLWVDSTGTVVRDSTRIAESSGQTAFDAAALQAAPTLRFEPARRGDTLVAAPIQVPIHFVLPDTATTGNPQ